MNNFARRRQIREPQITDGAPQPGTPDAPQTMGALGDLAVGIFGESVEDSRRRTENRVQQIRNRGAAR